MPLAKINPFGRLKPDSDRKGGTTSEKLITGWDEKEGSIDISDKGKSVVFDIFNELISPDAKQVEVYETVAAPLVEKWLAGYDADLLLYGQTGSGKTFTCFGPPFSMAAAAKKVGKEGGCGISPEGILLEEHGFILRAGFSALAKVAEINSKGDGSRAVLHASMVEISIFSLTDQSVTDLLNKRSACFVDEQHHLQGALLVPIQTGRDLVNMAAAVETRLTRGY